MELILIHIATLVIPLLWIWIYRLGMRKLSLAVGKVPFWLAIALLWLSHDLALLGFGLEPRFHGSDGFDALKYGYVIPFYVIALGLPIVGHVWETARADAEKQ